MSIYIKHLKTLLLSETTILCVTSNLPFFFLPFVIQGMQICVIHCIVFLCWKRLLDLILTTCIYLPMLFKSALCMLSCSCAKTNRFDFWQNMFIDTVRVSSLFAYSLPCIKISLTLLSFVDKEVVKSYRLAYLPWWLAM